MDPSSSYAVAACGKYAASLTPANWAPRADRDVLISVVPAHPGHFRHWMEELIFGGRILLITIFSISFLKKIRPPAFRLFVGTTTLFLPKRFSPYANRIAPVVLVMEGLVVLLLLSPSLFGFGALLSAGLLTTFTISIMSLLKKKSEVPCNCFGSSREKVGPLEVIRNLFLIIVSASLILSHSSVSDGLTTSASIIVAAAAVVLAVIFINIDEIYTLFR